MGKRRFKALQTFPPAGVVAIEDTAGDRGGVGPACPVFQKNDDDNFRLFRRRESGKPRVTAKRPRFAGDVHILRTRGLPRPGIDDNLKPLQHQFQLAGDLLRIS